MQPSSPAILWLLLCIADTGAALSRGWGLLGVLLLGWVGLLVGKKSKVFVNLGFRKYKQHRSTACLEQEICMSTSTTQLGCGPAIGSYP